jgi:Ca2+-binding RTX toxin-like protein
MSPRHVSRVRDVCAAATLVLLAPFVHDAVAQAGSGPTCFGKAATIVGPRPGNAAGETRVIGTAGPDVIFSRWDDQFIFGRGGDDLLCGHAEIHGGPGDDRLSVRSEKAFLDASSLYGGPGNDIIHRDEALDEDPHFANGTYGGPGRDRLFGSANLDDLLGGPGPDRIFGNGLHDEVYGGRGSDIVVGGLGFDALRGGPGADRLRGEVGNDGLHGGSGNDLARGGVGDDEISGGDGVDVAYGGPDVDSCQAETVRCELP